jgi:hypothetical protein
MDKDNRISNHSNGLYSSNAASSLKQAWATAKSDPLLPLRSFVVERPATALFTGAAIGSVLGWAMTRIK